MVASQSRPAYAQYVQPVKGASITTRLQSLTAKDFNAPLDNIRIVYDSSTRLAVDFEEGRDAQRVEEIEERVKQFIDMEYELTLQKEIIQEMETAARSGKEFGSLAKEFESTYSRKMQEYRKRSEHDKYSTHEGYREFKIKIWEVRRIGTAPFQDSEAEILVAEVHERPVCPLTRQIFKDPCTTKECNHSFERDAIMGLLAEEPNLQCPVVGCNKFINKASLVGNKELQRKAREYAETQREEEDKEADEMEAIE